MSLVLTREEVRRLDAVAIRDFGIPGIVLMENAGRGAAEVLVQLGIGGRVVVWCGKGNNGGDGFVLARHLAIGGYQAHVRLFAMPTDLRGDAAMAHRMLSSCTATFDTSDPNHLSPDLVEELGQADWVVDGLFGTGLQGPIRSPWDGVVRLMNDHGKRVLALDLPSGLDANTGAADGMVVRATHTVTFAALKPGLLVEAARPYVGESHVSHIGVDAKRLLQRSG